MGRRVLATSASCKSFWPCGLLAHLLSKEPFKAVWKQQLYCGPESCGTEVCCSVTAMIRPSRNWMWRSQTAPTHPSTARSLPLPPRPACEPPPPPSLWPVWVLLTMATRLCSACLVTGLPLEALPVAPRPGCPVGPPKVRRLRESTTTPNKTGSRSWHREEHDFKSSRQAFLYQNFWPSLAPATSGLPCPRTAKEPLGPGCLPIASGSQCER